MNKFVTYGQPDWAMRSYMSGVDYVFRCAGGHGHIVALGPESPGTLLVWTSGASPRVIRTGLVLGIRPGALVDVMWNDWVRFNDGS